MKNGSTAKDGTLTSRQRRRDLLHQRLVASSWWCSLCPST